MESATAVDRQTYGEFLTLKGIVWYESELKNTSLWACIIYGTFNTLHYGHIRLLKERAHWEPI